MPRNEEEKKALNFSSVGELNKISEDVKLAINNAFQCKQYCKAANDIFRKADNFYKTHDEEQAYMLFMRYFHIVQNIKKSYEFVKSKNVYLTILNECQVGSAITKAEQLSASLHSRYKKRDATLLEEQENEKKKSIEAANLKKSAQNGEEANAPKAKTSGNLLLPEVPNGFVPKNDENETSHDGGNLPPTAPGKLDDQPSLYPSKGFVSVTELYALLKEYKSNLDALMIIDIRPVEEYSASRINHSCMINVPENLLQFGANINSIERKLNKQTWEVWSSRFEKDVLVIMDYEFDNVSTMSSSLFLLQGVLCKFEAKYRVLALTGGFKKWILHYPSMTTNPFYSKKPVMPTLLDSTVLLKDLTYPELPSAEKKRNEQSVPPANLSTNEFKTLPSQEKTFITTGMPTSLINKDTDIKPADVSNPNILPNNKNMNNSHASHPSIKNIEIPPSTKTQGITSTVITNILQPSSTSKTDQSSVLPYGDIISTTVASTKPLLHQNKMNTNTLSNQTTLNTNNRNIGENMKNNDRQLNVDNVASVSGNIAAPMMKPSNGNVKGTLTTTIPASISSVVITTQASGQSMNSSVSNLPSNLNLPTNISQHSVATTTIIPNVLSSIKPINTSVTKVTTSTVPNTPSSVVPNVSPSIVPNVSPSVVPNVSPSIVPNVSPSIVPNVSPSVVPNVSPSIVPNVSPSVVPNVSPSIVANVSPSIVANVSPSVTPNSSIVKNNSSSSVVPNNIIPIPSIPINKNVTVPTSNLTSQKPGDALGGVNVPAIIPNIVPSTTRGISSAAVPPTVTTIPGGVPQSPHSVKGIDQKTVPPKKTMQQPPAQKNNTNNRKFTTTFGLPTGWEKAVSHETGRIYYKDHNTQTTHWTLPAEILTQIHKNEGGHVEDVSAKPAPQVVSSEEKKPSMKRSLSSPNLADLLNDGAENVPKEKNVSAKPVIDRSVKPKEQKQVLVDRTKKPISASRLNKLSPVYGSLGHALTGLKNLGNTCYMNSVIQCLSNTLPLSKYFTSGLYEQDLNTQNMNSRPGEIARELSFVIIVLSAGQYRSVSPLDFKNALGRFSSQFNGCQQQDSHELLMFLLDGLHEDINKVKSRQSIKEKRNENLPDHVCADQAWEDYLLNNDSIIVNLFQGQFRSTVVCLFCGHKSKTFDAFNCLQLELPSNKSATLEDCISSFTKAEKIGGNDSWKCSKCKCYREASKTIEVWKLPPVLIVQLKRFRCDGRWRNKIQSAINFPLRNLNMTNHIVSPKSQFSNYHLYGVINHYGSFESGHYTAYCENVHTGKWYCFDDNIVKELDSGTIKTNAAYLLFYTAVDFKDYLS